MLLFVKFNLFRSFQEYTNNKVDLHKSHYSVKFIQRDKRISEYCEQNFYKFKMQSFLLIR